jgi:putative transcriptional regulator
LTDTTPVFHLEPEVLLAYSAGSLDEANSVLTATHLALCPRCRHEVARLDAVGGILTTQLAPTALASDALTAVLARLDEVPSPVEDKVAAAIDDETRHWVPEPLRHYIGTSLSALPWKRRGFAIHELPLSLGAGSVRASLIRTGGGAALPAHSHDGVETTLVLRGAFRDDSGRYARGDVSTATSADDHRPVADPDDECLCFSVIDGSLRLTGRFGRLLNPFIRI